ncbi:hypothetical protein MAM1_0017d01550 [Mucor ambiguus]|uniref:Uncharacterized protein n=1 Tax=Mucor ambiguus TaxID=91626 RepID=A0A0C9LRE6_9FUNG|nr:hypothetical protein MAM1_0017d01550 [Mucor ambiguus]
MAPYFTAVTEVVTKRIFKMVATVNDNVCDSVEQSVKKTKIMEVNKSVHEINREISDKEEEELTRLRGIGVIPPYQLSTSCKTLVNAIEKSPPSIILLRQALRTNTLLPGEIFTIATHADLNFVEVVGTHFINLMDSPVNPLTSKKLERGVALHTTIIVLNNLFLADNDIIDLCWLERLTDHTGSTKWDGIGFSVSNRKLVPLLIEFSGAIQHNNTIPKMIDDENKLIKGMKSVLAFTETLTDKMPLPIYYCRFYDSKIFFESLGLLDNHLYLKRTHCIVTCPTTPKELQKFIYSTNTMFAWKSAVVNFASDINDCKDPL